MPQTRRRPPPKTRRNKAPEVRASVRVAPLTAPVRAAVGRIARAAVSKAAEDKFVGAHYTNTFNDVIGNVGDALPLMPAIGPGTADFQRNGDRVTGKYLYVKGMVQYTVGSAYYPPRTCRALVLSQKNIKTTGQITAGAVDLTHLLKDNIGTGTARAYSGGVFDNLAPINKDLFHVFMDRKFRFKFRQNTATTDPNTMAGAMMEGTNPTRYFTCRIKLPKTLTFDDGNGNYPNNFAPFFCLGAVSDDGSAPYTTGTPWQVQVQSIAYYEDT